MAVGRLLARAFAFLAEMRDDFLAWQMRQPGQKNRKK